MENVWSLANFFSMDGNRYLYEDGSIAGAVYSIDKMYESGVRILFLTPRFDYAKGLSYNLSLMKKIDILIEYVYGRYPGMKLIRMGLMKYFHGSVETVENNTSYHLNMGKYVLCEFEKDAAGSFVQKAAELYMDKGYRIIIPDILSYSFSKDINVVDSVTQAGAYIGVDASFFTEKTDKTVRRIADELLNRDFISFISQKTCKIDSIGLMEVYKNAAKYMGNEKAGTLMYDNYFKVINNQYI